jgi:hypothetical protein
MTGADAYTRHATRLLDMSKTVPDSAPTAVAPVSLANIVATPGSGQVSIAFTAYSGTATSIDAWQYGPISAGRTPTIVQARHKVYAPGETTPLVITGLTAGIHAFFLRAVSETDGQASAFLLVTATVT